MKTPATGSTEGSPVLTFFRSDGLPPYAPCTPSTTLSQWTWTLSICQHLFLQVLGGPEFAAAVNHMDLLGEAAQEDGLGEGVVAAAHQGDLLVPVEGAVAGGAVAYPFAGEPRLPREPPGACNGPRWR